MDQNNPKVRFQNLKSIILNLKTPFLDMNKKILTK